MKRASENGLHRRFYANHREELKRKKAAIGAKTRRADPLFGVWRDIRSGDQTRVRVGLKKLSRIIDELD
jgi:hypothetical protein